MTPNRNQRTLSGLVKEIAPVLGLMIAIFTVLEIFLPTSLVQPLGALVSGLVLTALLACVGKWNWGTMLTTWLAVGMVLIILYLIVSRPATVVGTVEDSSGSPAVGLTLVLTDSNGVDHKKTTVKNGAFEIKNVPEGKFTVLVNGELLIRKRVPSGWKRIIDSKMELGALVHRPGPTATPVVVAAVTPDTPTATPVAPTDTPSLPPTLTPTPTPTATPTNTPTPTPTPTATPTNTPTRIHAMPDAFTVAQVRVRSGPGKVYDIIGILSPYQVLTVTGRNDDATWLQVNTDKVQEGWVNNMAELVTLNLSPEQIPTVLSPPTPTPPPVTFTGKVCLIRKGWDINTIFLRRDEFNALRLPIGTKVTVAVLDTEKSVEEVTLSLDSNLEIRGVRLAKRLREALGVDSDITAALSEKDRPDRQFNITQTSPPTNEETLNRQGKVCMTWSDQDTNTIFLRQAEFDDFGVPAGTTVSVTVLDTGRTVEGVTLGLDSDLAICIVRLPRSYRKDLDVAEDTDIEPPENRPDRQFSIRLPQPP